MAGAIGGVALPVAIYLGVTAGDPAARAGWAIPAATDIAFALGVLALFGSRIPAALTVFLATLAVIDDLFAILAIALFYSDGLTFGALAGAVAVFVALLVAGRRGVASRWVHLVGFALIWFLMLKSGLHATMAGVLAAFTFPLHDSERAASCPARTLERDLARPVAFFILPLFALANAGISLDGVRMGDLLEGATLGTILGLALGKPVGILAACALAVRLGWARLPSGVSRSMLAGAAMICGIGFTMSLFIGALAFRGAAGAVDPRLGILLGSALAAGAGALTLRRAVAVPSTATARRGSRSAVVDATG
ncbi:MAG: Na+/H+ antiporter NhaA [Planctomycetota bacterium]